MWIIIHGAKISKEVLSNLRSVDRQPGSFWDNVSIKPNLHCDQLKYQKKCHGLLNRKHENHLNLSPLSRDFGTQRTSQLTPIFCEIGDNEGSNFQLLALMTRQRQDNHCVACGKAGPGQRGQLLGQPSCPSPEASHAYTCSLRVATMPHKLPGSLPTLNWQRLLVSVCCYWCILPLLRKQKKNCSSLKEEDRILDDLGSMSLSAWFSSVGRLWGLVLMVFSTARWNRWI